MKSCGFLLTRMMSFLFILHVDTKGNYTGNTVIVHSGDAAQGGLLPAHRVGGNGDVCIVLPVRPQKRSIILLQHAPRLAHIGQCLHGVLSPSSW